MGDAPGGSAPAAPATTSPTVDSVHASVPIGAIPPKPPKKRKKDAASDDDMNEDDKQTLTDSDEGVIRLTEDGSPASWHFLLPEGNRRHPKGTLKFTPTFLQKLSDNFHNKVRVVEPLVDTDHNRGEANGWIKDVRYLPGHGIDVKSEWTDLGEDRIRKKRFKYLSAEFGPYESERTGETFSPVLNCVSLTNVPYLKELGEVTLTQLSEIGMFEFAENATNKSPRATSANPDPDDDGDNDSTKEGDTDDDFTGPDGNRKPKKGAKKPAAMSDDNNVDERFYLSVSAAERTKVSAEDFAGPHESFPINTQKLANSAWDLAGHAADPDAVRARIKAIAKRKGYTLPATASTKDTSMNENENAQSAQLTELTTQLGEVTRQLGELAAENKSLREDHKATKTQLREATVEKRLTKLSEAREIEVTSEDGATSKGMTQGFSTAALAEAKKLILEHDALEDGLLRFMEIVQETGMVPLSELGVGRSSDEHDLIQMPASSRGEQDGIKLTEQAQAFARKTYQKDLASLSETERLGVFRAVGFKGEFTA